MKATVHIPHISWRDGRPRFNPGPALRRRGCKGEDLRHADGRWFDLREAEDWARAKIATLDAAPKRRAPAPKPDAYSLADLFEDLYASRRFLQRAPATQRDYRVKSRAFFDFDPALQSAPAAAMTPAIAQNLHEALWKAKGLAMANGMIAVLRLAFSEAIRRGRGRIASNPCLQMALPAPQGRIRCASREEIEALLAAAEAAEPSVADAIVIALFTGQRQGDVLALEEAAAIEGRVRLRQRKTGAVVSVFALPPLVARLAAIRARKRAAGLVAPTIVLHPRTLRPWKGDAFRHRFAEIRAVAAAQCATLADFHFADLRDTAVTWLHRAGCTAEEIGSVTGHSSKTVHAVLRKHYLAIDEGTNNRAMAKLGAWLEGEG